MVLQDAISDLGLGLPTSSPNIKHQTFELVESWIDLPQPLQFAGIFPSPATSSSHSSQLQRTCSYPAQLKIISSLIATPSRAEHRVKVSLAQIPTVPSSSSSLGPSGLFFFFLSPIHPSYHQHHINDITVSSESHLAC